MYEEKELCSILRIGSGIHLFIRIGCFLMTHVDIVLRLIYCHGKIIMTKRNTPLKNVFTKTHFLAIWQRIKSHYN